MRIASRSACAKLSDALGRNPSHHHNEMSRKIPIFDGLELLYSSVSQQTFAENSVAFARILFPEAMVAWHELVIAPEFNTRHFCQDGRVTLKIRNAWQRHARDSPVIRYYLAGGNDPAINTFELISDSALRNTGLYADCWKPFGVKYQVGLRLSSPNSIRGLSIKRDRKFRAGDSAVLRSLYPHFRRVSMFLNEPRSKVEGSAHVNLTARENEVLSWVRHGKRDAEVACILGISTKTVNKHMEHIMAKLGVETRTAAATCVTQ
jgi:DNA-binding CsgD family transcriptional regulator